MAFKGAPPSPARTRAKYKLRRLYYSLVTIVFSPEDPEVLFPAYVCERRAQDKAELMLAHIRTETPHYHHQ